MEFDRVTNAIAQLKGSVLILANHKTVSTELMNKFCGAVDRCVRGSS